MAKVPNPPQSAKKPAPPPAPPAKFLFPETEIPKTRKKRQLLMHVYDCGPSPYESQSGKLASYVLWKCHHCGYAPDWQHVEASITELKKGTPCPKCNGMEKGVYE